MYQYHNYAYSSGVPDSQNVAAYSTRHTAAASHNPFTSTILSTDNAGPRRTDEAAANKRDLAPMLSSPSCRHLTPAGASKCLDQSPADLVPPPPIPTSMTSPGTRPAYLASPPARGPAAGAIYSSPLDRVAVSVDADDNEDQPQHSRSHSAPAAPRRRIDHQHCRPPNMPGEKRTDAERRHLPSPPPPPSSAATSTPRDTNVRHRPTSFPLSDAELNGPLVDASATTRHPNSVSLPAAGCDPMLTRRRLRAARGRLNYQYTTDDCGLGSTLAGMAIIAVVALVFSAVGVQLLLRLTAETTHDVITENPDSLIPAATSKPGGRSTITRTVVEEVAVALTAVTVACDLCCLFTVSMQCFFAVKLAHSHNGRLRVSGYLAKCSVARTVASAGLFLSIPIFLLALMLYAVLEYTFTSAITCVIVFTVGIVCITIIAAHSIHCWNVEKSSAECTVKSPSSVLPHDISKHTVNSDDSALKLSTLV